MQVVIPERPGFDPRLSIGRRRGRRRPCFHAPNFAVGAVLMMQFAEEASRWVRKSWSSTPTRSSRSVRDNEATAARMEARCRSTRFACRASSRRRSSSAVPAKRRHPATRAARCVRPGVLRAIEAVRDLAARLDRRPRAAALGAGRGPPRHRLSARGRSASSFLVAFSSESASSSGYDSRAIRAFIGLTTTKIAPRAMNVIAAVMNAP